MTSSQRHRDDSDNPQLLAGDGLGPGSLPPLRGVRLSGVKVRAKRTQSGQTGRRAGSPKSANVRNEPNLAPLHPATGCNGAKQSQFGPGVQASAGRDVRNKPNSARLAGRPGLRRAKMCETNPIGAGNAGAGRTERTKRTQFPAGPGRTGPRVRGANVQNEPNFGERTGRGRGRLCETNPIWDSPPGVRGPIVRNKANSRRSRVGRGLGGRGANVQNEPNSRPGQVGRGRRGVGRWRIAQNEPNFSIADCGPRSQPGVTTLRIADSGRICGGTPALRPAASSLGPFPGPMARNKPNRDRGQARTSGRWETSYDEYTRPELWMDLESATVGRPAAAVCVRQNSCVCAAVLAP